MPYISTALALQEQGADVSILAPRDFSQHIASSKIDLAGSTEFSVEAWMSEAAVRGTLKGPFSFFRDWGDMIQPHIDEVMQLCLAAAEGSDVIVSNLICPPARIASEAFGVPFILTGQQPVLSPTREQPCAMMWRPWHGDRLNRKSYAVINVANRVIGASLKRHRKKLGLPKRPRISNLRTHLGKPLPKISTIPAPIMPKRPTDWTSDDHLMAYPSLTSSALEKLSAGLQDFLASGSAPVYIGLGSLGQAHGSALLDAAVQGLEQVGCRGLISKSMINADTRLSDQFYVVAHEPHDKLFGQCAAVMHHAGAGTSDTALRAGVPQILQPHFLDQFWFSDRLKQLGVAPKALPSRKLDASDIVEAVQEALSAQCVARTTHVKDQALMHSGARDLAAFIMAQQSFTA